MSQHDLTIDNQGFPAFRADLNNALQALGSTQSGTTAPSPTFANQLWYDTTNNQLKIRNEDNDAWITLLTLDQVADALSTITASTVNAGALAASGNVSFDGGTFVFNDSGADKDFRIEGDTDANLFFTDASTDRVGIGTNSPASKLDILTSGTTAELTLKAWGQSATTTNAINFWYLDGGGSPYNNASIKALSSANAGNGSLVFYTRPTSGSLTERLSIPSDAAGITFPATQSASSDANTLDDYEEGTWTPTVTSGTGSITTYSITTAKYTKIGNFVFIDLVIYVANIGTAGGNCTFTLPFTSATACGVYGREYNNAGYGLQGLINGTSASGYVFNTKADNGSAWAAGNGLALAIGCMYPIS